MSQSVNLRHLTYLVTAAERGSITDAAVELGVSQPAISAAIKGFEEDYGYLIFIRNPAQGLALTSAGRLFIQQAYHLLESSREFDQQARGLGQEFSGSIQIGCYFITAPYLLPPVVQQFQTNHPKVSLDLHESDLAQVIVNLKNGVTDIAVTYDMYLDAAVTLEKLFPVQPHVIVAADDPLAKQSSLSLHDLVDKPMILLDLPVTQDYFLNFFHAYGLTPNVQYRLKSFEMVRSLVGVGCGFSFGFLPLHNNKTYQGNVMVRIPLKENLPNPWVCLAYSNQLRPTRILQAFMQDTRRVLSSAFFRRVQR